MSKVTAKGHCKAVDLWGFPCVALVAISGEPSCWELCCTILASALLEQLWLLFILLFLCLGASVFWPPVAAAKQLPVMVFPHVF